VLASSTAVLTSDERELGVVLVDIGAGTTDIAVFVQGAIAHSASLPIAGDKVTEDIAHMLRTPTPEAEQIKVRYACALAQMATAEESIQVPSVGDRPPRRMPRASLAQAVQARYEEIFEMIQAELRRSGFEQHVRAGMVLTGGAAKMEGVVELAEEMLQMPVRVGIPQHVTGPGRSGRQPGARHRRRPAADGQPDREPAAPDDFRGSRRQPLQPAEELVPGRILIRALPRRRGGAVAGGRATCSS
jgi:cell division protein FtsA